MADLLPSTPDTSAVDEADPRVIGVDSDEASDLLGALSSDTARGVLSALHNDPANPAKLADAVDTSLQNAQYHLSKLEEAGLVEVIDTVYSEKGREMNVYAPSDRPLVVYAGKEEETTGLRAALSRLLGAFSALALGSVMVQEFFGGGFGDFFQLGGGVGAPSGEDGAAGGPGTDTEAAADSPTPDAGDPIGNGDATGTPVGEPSATAGDAGTSTATATDVATETGGASGTPTSTPAATGTPTSTPASTQTEAPSTMTPTPTEVLDTATQTAEAVDQAGQAAGLPPGLVFFLGGATVIATVALFSYVR